MNSYYHAHIEEIIEHNKDTKSFILDTDLKADPGQFVMAWLPGFDEKPFSLSGKNMVTVKKVGPFTEKLFEKSRGYLDIRGPYGNGFPNIGMNTAIGGGSGIASLISLLSMDEPSATSLTGFVLAGKTKSDLIFLEQIIKTFESSYITDHSSKNVIAVTEEGSYGTKGLVTDAVIPEAEHNYYICGPEPMMENVAEKLISQGIDSKKIYLSIERYMKCGVGICGNCSFSGYRVCTDGPIFRYDKIQDLPHFNKLKRTRTGELIKFNNIYK